MTANIEIDSPAPPSSRSPEILAAIDALVPGAKLVVFDPEDPLPLCERLEREHPRRYDWSFLDRRPGQFRVEIRRRLDESPRTISGHLGADHQRLDGILADATRIVDGGDFPDARDRFAEFTCGLERHIEMEERVLFPVFEEKTGIAVGPTRVMRAEHVEIRRLVGNVRHALGDLDAAGFLVARLALERVLGEHDAKEERVLYPALDRIAGGPEACDGLVVRMQLLS